jgi:riboflavin kinase/FMN adenylyltransferase
VSPGFRLRRGFPERRAFARDVVATIGVFDGVHLGHQRLLQEVVSRSRSGADMGVLITFDPHPRCVLDPDGCPPLLSGVAERAGLAARHGVASTVALEFSAELARWSAQRFCDRLVESVPLRCLVVGPGFALGRARAGDEAFLRQYGAAHGVEVVSVDPLMLGGERVSSGRIRHAVLEGRVEDAAELLGRFHHLPGTVVVGDMRGRTLGFPTANLASEAGRCLPAAGVYATWLYAAGSWLRSATSVGVRPTFGGEMTTVEAFALDFDGDLYGAAVELQFVARLREERKYPDASSLVAQMRDDVAQVRTLMADVPEPEPLLP